MADSTWTKERLKKLEKLWDKGLSISEIGKELGVSRNSIAGKVNRLGLEKRRSPISETNEKVDAGRPQTIQDMDASKLPLKIALRNIDWSHSKCSWPIGDPKSNEFSFCGEEVVQGKPYCNDHCFEAYTTDRESGSA